MAVDGISEKDVWIPPPLPIAEEDKVEQKQQQELAQASKESAQQRTNPAGADLIMPGHSAQLSPIETKDGPNDSTRQYFSEPGSKEQFYKQNNKDGSWAYYRDDGIDSQGHKTATPLKKVDKDGNEKQLPEGNRNLYDKYKGILDKFEAAMTRKSLNDDYNPPPVIPSEALSEEVATEALPEVKEGEDPFSPEEAKKVADTKTTDEPIDVEKPEASAGETESSTKTGSGEAEETKTGQAEETKASSEAEAKSETSPSEPAKEEKSLFSLKGWGDSLSNVKGNLGSVLPDDYKAKILATTVEKMSDHRDTLEGEAKEAQIAKDKEAITNLIAPNLPEDKQHLAGIAASLLVQAKDNPETTDINELSELTKELAGTDKNGKLDISSIFSKADAALRHLDREQFAEVYSNVVDFASKFDKEGVDHNKILAALSGDQEAIKEFGLEAEQIKDAKIALVNGGLDFLKDEIGLTQDEVDKMSQLYKLSESLMGADGKFNEADIPALAATLGLNDVKTLTEARELIESTIMSQVSNSAHDIAKAEATRQYNNHPDVQRGRRMLQRPLVRFFAGGMIRSELNKGWGKAMGIANREASKAINGIRSNLGDDFGSLSRAMTAIETRDQLREGLGVKDTESKIGAEEAGEYFKALNKESLSSLAGDKEKLAKFLETTEKNFNALNRASIEAQVSSSIKDSRDVKGDIKDQLLGVNKYLSILANYENRDGMTQEGLKQAKEGLETAENVLNRALGVTNDEDRVSLQDASELISEYQEGNLSIDDLPKALQQFIDPSLAAESDPSAETKKLTDQYLKGDGYNDLDREYFEENQMAAFKLNGEEYLGYKIEDESGKERIAFTNKEGKSYFINSDAMKEAYMEAAIRDGLIASDQQTAKDLKIDESLFDATGSKPYTQEVAEKFGQNSDPDYLAKYGMTAFQVNGKEYLGYISIPDNVDSSKLSPEQIREEGKLAFIDKEGNSKYISDEATKAAYYGAMMRDGQDVSSIRQFGTVDSQTQNEIFAIASSRKATENAHSSSTQRYSPSSSGNYSSSTPRWKRTPSGVGKPGNQQRWRN